MIARLVHRGVVGHEDLVTAGVGEGAIRWRLKKKRLHIVFEGWYLVGHADPPPLALAYAALQLGGPGSCISHRPAGVLWRSLPNQVDPTIHLTLKAQRKNRKELIRAAELPEPEVNKRMGRRMPDFAWREQRVIVEVDGFGAHGDLIAFESDRVRDAERTAGTWRPMRFTWRRIRDKPYAVVATLAATLAPR